MKAAGTLPPGCRNASGTSGTQKVNTLKSKLLGVDVKSRARVSEGLGWDIVMDRCLEEIFETKWFRS